MDRREFIGAAAALTATAALGAAPATLPKRPYKNGIDLSIIAMGGIVICGMSQEEASRRVAQAYDRGVNYFDCAPSYFNGEAEMKLGEALQPYRSKVFLAEKTMSRDAKGRGRGSWCGHHHFGRRGVRGCCTPAADRTCLPGRSSRRR